MMPYATDARPAASGRFTRPGVLAVVLCAMVLTGPAPATSPADPADPIDRARRLLESGEVMRAEQFLRDLHARGVRPLEAALLLWTIQQDDGHRLPVSEAMLEADLRTLDRTHPRGRRAFVRHESPWFVVLSDHDAAWTQRKLRLLDRTRSRFLRFARDLELPLAPPAEKLRVVMFQEHADYTSFALARDGMRAPWSGGYYAHRANRMVLFDPRTSPQLADDVAELDRQGVATPVRAAVRRSIEASAVAKVIHEAVHALSYNTGLQRRGIAAPFWLTEGLATSFETDRPDQPFGPFEEGSTRDRQLQRALRTPGAGGLVPVERLVVLHMLPAEAALEDTAIVYAQSHRLFSHLVRTHPEGVRRYLLDLVDLAPIGFEPGFHLDLFTSRFGPPDQYEGLFSDAAGPDPEEPLR